MLHIFREFITIHNFEHIDQVRLILASEVRASAMLFLLILVIER
jgi:hypothetical protein